MVKKNKVKHLGELGIDDPLQVIPVAEANVEAITDNKNLLQLRRQFAPKGGLYGWVARRLNYRHQVRINLDEHGSAFWKQMDGRKTLDTIASALATEFKLDTPDARKAVVLFTKMLMARHLIFLVVPGSQS